MPEAFRTVGVLGGMGPDSTVDFMSKVIALTPAERDQDHLHLIVDNDPSVPNRQAAILHGGEDPSAAIAAMGRRLEAAGADFLVMVCNSAHAFTDQLQDSTRIPFVSIIETTAEACQGHDAVGVLATDGCIASRLYQDALETRGTRAIVPDEDELAQLMDLVGRIKAGDRSENVAGPMRELAGQLAARGAQAIIAGCTEIPLVLHHGSIEVPVVSSTDELAAVTVAIARRERDFPNPLS